MGARYIKSLWFLVVAGFTLLSCPQGSGQSAPSAGSATTLNEYRENGLAYFPAGTFKKPDGSPDDDWADSWAWYLRGRGEPPLLRSTENSQAQAYRLTIIGFPGARTWIFRLQIEKNGTGRLFAKATPFDGTNFLLNRDDAISAADVNGFLESVKRAEFWQLPTREKPELDMPDGSYWFLEGTRQGEYHMVYRRSPEVKPSPYTDIGRYLSKDLANLPDSIIRIPRADISKPLRPGVRD